MMFVAVVTVALCCLRFAGSISPAYQAIAHLWCGVLIGAAYDRRVRRSCVVLAVVMVLAEIAMFIVDRG